MKKITTERYLSAAVIVMALTVSFVIVAKADNSEINLSPGQSWKGTIPAASKLSLEGRIVYARPAGGNYLLKLNINGKPVTSPLLNKGQSFKYQDGRTFAYKSGNDWMLFYSADMSANNSAAGGGYQVMTDPGQAYRYSWDVSALSRGSGQMDVEIKNVSDKYTIVGRLTSVAATTFPIPELGNCTSAAECKQYCDVSANISACAVFAEKNGMISKEEAAQAKEFADVLRGDGPGGCKTKDACESYCNGITNINECVAFASKHNLIPPDQLAQAQKVAKALKDGARLPGGCTDKKSCESYCADASHADTCLAFAEKAGFLSPEELSRAKKVLPLIASGDSPGKCQTKDQCEAYCAADGHALECANFAEKAGFMNKEEADIVRKTGGKGPGGCKSKDACESYCNDKTHQQECFDFAQKYDLIPADKLKEMKDGMGRLRSGLDQMPPDAISCLKDNLGQDIVTKIQDGTFTPGPQTGETIKGCFEKVMPQIRSQIEMGLKNAPPAVRNCLDNGLGSGGLEKIMGGDAPTPEMGDVMRKCFESMNTEGLKEMRDGLKKMPPEIRSCFDEKMGKEMVSRIENGEAVKLDQNAMQALQECTKNIGASTQSKMEEGLKQAPPEIRDCIKSKLGDVSAKMQSGELKGEGDIQRLIQECTKGFTPPGAGGVPGGMPPGMGRIPNMVPPGGTGGIPSMPPPGMGDGSFPAQGGAPTAPTPEMCAQFKLAPSCDYIPEQYRALCEQCR